MINKQRVGKFNGRTLKVIHRWQAFSSAICRTFVQHFTRFQVTLCLRPLCVSDLFVWIGRLRI